MRKVVATQNFSNKGIPFSQAILHDAKYQLEISGQIGVDTSGTLLEGIEAQTEQTLANIEAILAAAGWTLEHIVKARIFLTDMQDYQKMNEIYAKRFPVDPPARIALAVKELPLGALIEIECVAANNSEN